MAKATKAALSQMELSRMFAGVSETAMCLTLAIVDADVESRVLKEQIKSLREDLAVCGEVVWNGILSQRVEEKLPYETIKSLAREANPAAHAIPSTVKVYCSSMQSAETAGLTITMGTSHHACREKIKVKKAATTGQAEKDATVHAGENTAGELSDSAVVKQALALLALNLDLRVMYAAEIAKVTGIVEADKVKAEKAAADKKDSAKILARQAANRLAAAEKQQKATAEAKAKLSAEYAAAGLTKTA